MLNSPLAPALVLAALVGGCGSPTNNTGTITPADAAVVDASGAAGSIGCANTACPVGDASVCCLDLSFTPPFLTGTCAADPAVCTETALACDDATDCGAGQRCCAYQLTINGKQRNFSSCKPVCGELTNEREVCDRRGGGRCAGGAFCCRNDGDLLGVCVAAESACGVDAGAN